MYPQVIVSDRDLALMNAISVVFPEATNILCGFTLTKMLKPNVKCSLILGTHGTL